MKVEGDRIMNKKLSIAHLLIIVAWLIPYIPLLELRQFVTPFVVTVVFIFIDVVKSNAHKEYNHYIFKVLCANIVGMIIMTLEYEFSNYAFWQDANFGPGMGIVFAGLWDIIYCFLLAIALLIGYVAIKIKLKS